MARVTLVYSIDQVARMTGESLELIEVVSRTPITSTTAR